MEDLEKILQDASTLLGDVDKFCKDAAKEREAREIRGEYYNVFNVIGMWSDELKYSALIAELLDPNGTHGVGDEFLKAFLRLIPPKGHLSEGYLNVQSKKFKLDKERGFKINRKRGRIDIIVEDGEHAIVIENKINAEDQEGQLRKYYEYARDSFKGHELIYLTKYGDEPSEVSLRDIKAKTENKKDEEAAQEEVRKNCICMSYKDDIIPWLTECAKIAFNRPLVRETINQCIYLIKQLTNSTMENKQLEEIIKNATATVDSTTAATAILQARDEIGNALKEQFIFEPLRKLKPEVFKCEIDYDSHCITLSKVDWEKGYVQICTDAKRSWNGMYIGIQLKKEKKSEIKQLNCLDDGNNGYWPYGWKWVSIRDWDSPASYVDIRNGKIAEWLINKIEAITEELGREGIEL